MIITSADEGHRRLMWKFLNTLGTPVIPSDDFQALGQVKDDHIVAVVGYNGFVGKVAQMHVASAVPHWNSREFIFAAFDYPFRQLNLNYLIATVRADNEKALRFDRKIGFQDWEILPNGADDGVDLIILKMARDECRWLNRLKKAA